jgi:hypothetical protein
VFWREAFRSGVSFTAYERSFFKNEKKQKPQQKTKNNKPSVYQENNPVLVPEADEAEDKVNINSYQFITIFKATSKPTFLIKKKIG